MSSRRDNRLTALKPECNHAAYLPDEPRGYLAWHEWAEQKIKTHHQERCPHCGLYAIWVERRPVEVEA